VVSSEDEADGIEYRIFLLNRSEYKINDTWNATGLCGTGSNDVRVADTFVAEKMTVAVSDLTGGPTPGSDVNPSALYALPVFSLFPYVLSGVGLGNAQACLNDYVEFARHRASTYNRAKLSDMQTTQIKIAEASAKVDAARLLMRTNCVNAMADARRGHIPDIAAKTRLRRDGAFADGVRYGYALTWNRLVSEEVRNGGKARRKFDPSTVHSLDDQYKIQWDGKERVNACASDGYLIGRVVGTHLAGVDMRNGKPS